MKTIVLLGLIAIGLCFLGIQASSSMGSDEEVAKLVAEFLEKPKNKTKNSTKTNKDGKPKNRKKNPLEEVLDLFNKLIKAIQGELDKLIVSHDKQVKSSKIEIAALENQYNQEIDKCSKVGGVIDDLNKQLNDMQTKIKNNNIQVDVNKKNIKGSQKTMCKNGHDFFYALKNHREGIDLLALVRKLIMDNWEKQTKSTTLLEDHHLSAMVSGLLPNLLAIPYLQDDPAIRDIIDFVQKIAIQPSLGYQILAEQDQPNLRLKSFDTAFSSTSAQIQKLIETLDRVLQRIKDDMESLIATSIDRVVATDKYIEMLTVENAHLLDENKELEKNIEKVQRKIKAALITQETCKTSVDNCKELVEDAKFDFESRELLFNDRKKELEDDIAFIKRLMTMYKVGVYESAEAKAKVKGQTSKGKDTSKGKAGNSTKGKDAPPASEKQNATNTTADKPKDTKSAAGRSGDMVALFEAVSCDENGQCRSVSPAFQQYVKGSCLSIPKAEGKKLPFSYIYYHLKERVYTAVYDKNAAGSLFEVGECPCSNCNTGELKFLDSTYSVQPTQKAKRVVRQITNKLNSLVHGNTIHLSQPSWRSLLPKDAEQNGRDFELSLNYELNGVMYAIQTADTIPLGIGTVPNMSQLRVSRGILACDTGATEILSLAEINKFVRGGSYLELCYDDAIRAKEAQGKCTGEKRLCFEMAFEGVAHTACVRPNYCFKYGKRQA